MYKGIKNDTYPMENDYKIVAIKSLREVKETDNLMTYEELEDDLYCCSNVEYKNRDKVVVKEGIYRAKVSPMGSVDFTLWLNTY